MALKEQDVVLYTTDGDGNKVIQMPITRVENVEGVIKTVDGVAPDADGNVEVKNRIACNGWRGWIGGYHAAYAVNWTDGVGTINGNSPDAWWVNSAEGYPQSLEISNGSEQGAWTKILRISSTTVSSITLGSAWKWSGGTVPTIPTDGILICCWCGNMGIASIVH